MNGIRLGAFGNEIKNTVLVKYILSSSIVTFLRFRAWEC